MKERLLLVAILILGFFLRIYKLPETFFLDGDIARDWLIIFDAWEAKKPILVGPLASFAGIFNGPWYYYTMAPVVIISRLNPLAIISSSILLGLLEIFLVYQVANRIFGKKVALSVMLFYALSYSAIKISHSLWNPNFLPALALLVLFFLVRAIQEKKVFKITGALAVAGYGLQFHYGFTLLVPSILWISQKLSKYRFYWRALLLGFLVITAMFLPLAIFELRHQGVMTKTFILHQSTGHGGTIVDLVNNLILAQPFAHLLDLNFNLKLQPALAWVILVLLIFSYRQLKKVSEGEQVLWYVFFITLFLFMMTPLVVHRYYLNSLLPLSVLLWGSFLSRIEGLFFSVALFILVISFFMVLIKSDVWQIVANNLTSQQKVAKIIASDRPANHQFNIVVFGNRPFHSAWEYRFLVRNFGFKSLEADEYARTRVLYLVAEGAMDEPLKAKSFETVEFAPRKVENIWKLVNGWQVFKLVK